MNKRELIAGVTAVSAVTAISAASGRGSEAKVLVAYHSVSGHTEKLAQAVVQGIASIGDAQPVLRKVADVTTEDLLTADGVIIGSPVYFANVSGEVKTFLDNWLLKFGVMRDFKMRNKVGAAFVTGASVSNGKETTMQAIHAAMLVNQMTVVSGGGAFGASATTGPDSAGVDEKATQAGQDLGKRVAEVAMLMRKGGKT